MGGKRFTSLSPHYLRPSLKPLHLQTHRFPNIPACLLQLVRVETRKSRLRPTLRGLGEGATALGFADEDPCPCPCPVSLASLPHLHRHLNVLAVPGLVV